MELLKFQHKKRKDKFYGLLLDSLLSLQKNLDSQKENFNLNRFLLLIGEVLEKNGVSILVTIFSDKKDSISVRYLNDALEEKSLRKSFDCFFLDSTIVIEKANYFSRPYLKREVQYMPKRQKDIYRTYSKTKKYLSGYSFNSIICPILIKGEVIGFFEFISPKLKKEHLEILEVFVRGLVKSISNSLLFEELIKSEEKFKDIFENADEGFYVLNGKKKKFVEVNKALVKITGYTKEELLQMSYLLVFSPDERVRIDAYVKHRLEKKDSSDSPSSYETKITCKDGTEKNIKLNVSRYINDDEWFVIISDITIKKNVEKKLKEANENQKILNALLQISIDDIDLGEKIEKLLNTLIKISWAENKLSGGLWLLPEKKRKKLYFYSSKNFPKIFYETCTIDSLESSRLGRVILNKEVEVFEGRKKKELSEEDEIIKINSCYIPLMHKNVVLGALHFLFKEEKEFSIRELGFFKAISSIVASAVDREKNKLELEKSEEKYRDFVDNAGDMFVMLDLNNEIVFANQSFYFNFPKNQTNISASSALKDSSIDLEQAGQTVEEKNENFINIVNKDSREKFRNNFRDFAKKNINKKIEFKTRGGGKILYVSANFTNVIKKGKKIGVQAIIRDITDTKLAEQKIYETKKHYLSVVDTIRDGIFVVDKTLKILSYNKFFAEKVELPVEMIKNRKCPDILPKYENNLFLSELKREKNMSHLIRGVFKTKEFRSIERKTVYKKKVFYYKIDISPTKNSKGETYQAVVTISNITKNREAEEEIRKLDEFKNRVLNNVPVSIAMLDKKGKIISLNSYALELMGKKLENNKLISTKEIKNNKKLVTLYNNLIKKGKSFKYENLSYQPVNSEDFRYLNIIAAPLFDAKGGVEGAISIAVDNTESTMYREKIENLNQELEKKVEQRTGELDAVNKKLNRALELKLKFISDASHELRTPLTIMKGNLDLLFIEEKKIDEKLLEVYRDIEDEIERMSRIISDLTMLTNADSEMEKLHYEQVNMTKLIELVVKSLLIIAREKNISLKFGHHFRDFFIMGDEVKLEKIVINLIRNAIKYTDENGWIKIFLNKNEENITLTIKDNGIGIPEKDLPNIFERFYRVDKARSRVEGGTGLGLSICKWMVEAHGGQISVKSEESVGSEFIVKLPLNNKKN